MAQLLTRNSSPYALFREKFRYNFFQKGITPADARQPIPDELAIEMIQELNVPKDSLIGVFDAFLILTTHLREQGYNNIVLLESLHNNLTSKQEEYYNTIKQVCEQSSIKYYVPPMNNYGRCDMKFDVIIGNPPYQRDENDIGKYRGSGGFPLWMQIVDKSLTLVKENGIISFITPQNFVNGGDKFTKICLGPNRKYDLKKVDFEAANHFKVGIPICRWTLKNTYTNENLVEVSDSRLLNNNDTLKITNNSNFDVIIDRLYNSKGKKLNFNLSGCYHFGQVQTYLKNNSMPVEWAKDLKTTKDETYCYPININGKIKYSRVKWKMSGTWRLFIAKMQNPLKVEISKDWEADGSTFTMVFDSEDDALLTQSYLENPIYKWIIEQTRVSGRVNGTTISKLPNTPIEEVLTPEQISYIKSQLDNETESLCSL